MLTYKIFIVDMMKLIFGNYLWIRYPRLIGNNIKCEIGNDQFQDQENAVLIYHCFKFRKHGREKKE